MKHLPSLCATAAVIVAAFILSGCAMFGYGTSIRF
jgi:hypothetical protein